MSMFLKRDIKSVLFSASIIALLSCFPAYSQEPSGLKEDSLALKILQNTLSKNPNSKVAKLSCAKVYIKSGNYKESEQLLKEVLSQDPDNKSAKNMLGELNAICIGKNLLKSKTNVKPATKTKSETKKSIDNKSQLEVKAAKEGKPKVESQIKTENKTVLGKDSEISKTKETPQSKIEIIKKNKKVPQTKSVVPQIAKKEETKTSVVHFPTKDEIIRRAREKRKLDNQCATIIKKEEPKQFSLPTKDEILKKAREKKRLESNLVKPLEIEKLSTNKGAYVVNTAKSAFLEETSQSFFLNLDEAICKIESNKLKEAENYIEKATLLAIASRDGKKVYDIQLIKGIIYIYQCDFEKYGKHIMSIQKGISNEAYQTLFRIYEKGIKEPDQASRLKYVANIAYDSAHYSVAKGLLLKYKSIAASHPNDYELLKRTEENLRKINGEYLLKKGSYMSALEVFERENNEVEKGRTYLAISKSLTESGEIKEAKIAESFGKTTLLDCLKNDPNDPTANLYLALYYLDNGNKIQAKEAIRRGLNSKSNNDLVNTKLLNLSENL